MLLVDLPTFVKESLVFSEEEKIELAKINAIPSELEVDAFRNTPAILDLTNAFIGDDNTRNIHLQEKAKDYIRIGDLDSAWKLILV